jgi:hypothetical protein
MERIMHDAMGAYNYKFLTEVPDWSQDYAPNGKFSNVLRVSRD